MECTRWRRPFRNGQGGIIEPLYPRLPKPTATATRWRRAWPTWSPPGVTRASTTRPFTILKKPSPCSNPHGCDTDATALCTSAGMSAIKQSVEPFLEIRDGQVDRLNFVSAAQVYGGTFQLFNLRMKERGAKVRWVTRPWEMAEWESLVDEDTRFVYLEMPSNPQQACTDIARWLPWPHRFGIPLVVDATIATPALMRPLAWGPMWWCTRLTKNGWQWRVHHRRRHRRPEGHHLQASPGRGDFRLRLWLKLWPFRDSGPCMSPYSAFFLAQRPAHPAPEDGPVQQQYHDGGAIPVRPSESGAGGLPRPAGASSPRAGQPVHDPGGLGGARFRAPDVLYHPRHGGRRPEIFDKLERSGGPRIWGGSSRWRPSRPSPPTSSRAEEGRRLAGVPPTMVRLCVGGEHPDDVIADLDQAWPRSEEIGSIRRTGGDRIRPTVEPVCVSEFNNQEE